MSTANLRSTGNHECDCGKKFLRKEHLRRHEATHRDPSFDCQLCHRSFTRSDLLRRHHSVRHANEAALEPRVRRACKACRSSKTKCNGGTPCTLCTKRSINCLYDHQQSAKSAISAGVFAKAPSKVKDDALGIDARNLRLIQDALDAPSHAALKDQLQDCNDDFKIWSTNCVNAYLGHFHAHWPVLHGPTFDISSEPLKTSAAVLMIGCWLICPPNVTKLINAVHRKLMDLCLQELCGSEFEPRRNLPWKFEEYQAILLNIIFAFYCHNERLLARAQVLLSVFTTSLRQVGFFNSKTATHQEQTHFPGTFVPFLLSNRQKRIRLVVSLFKIDTCFSLISGYCPHIQIEELDVELPSTYALWNAHGLDEVYRRFPEEPAARSGVKIIDFLQHPELLGASCFLLEDISIGLCGLYRAVWKYNMMRRNARDSESLANGELYKAFQFWGARLDRVSDSSETHQLGFYKGAMEEASSTLARFKSLELGVRMLYNIVGLRVYSERDLLILFGIGFTGPGIEASAPALSQERKAHIENWVLSADGRNAVSFCINTLETRNSLVGRNLDLYIEPLTDVAVSNSTAALSMWFRNTEDT